MDDTEKALQSYAEFWPFYLSQHKKPAVRLIHCLGTLFALLIFLKAIVDFSLLWLLAALAVGYGFAWIAHAFIEKNHPATFTYPLWSLRGDFHMLGLWLMGRLENELSRYHLNSER